MSLRWYAHYLQDYEDDTRDLTMQQDGCYRRLIDHCYKTGEALPVDLGAVHRIARAFSASERKDVGAVLNRYFVQSPDGWHNKRVDEELQRTAEISQQRSKAAYKRHANAPANAPANADTVTVTSTEERSPSLRSGDAKPHPKASKRSVPENFPDEDSRKWAETHWLAKGRADLCAAMDDEIAKFRDHHTANNKPSADWPGSWRTWARNAVNFSKAPRNGATQQPAKIFSSADLELDR